MGTKNLSIMSSVFRAGGAALDNLLRAGQKYDQRIHRSYAKSLYGLSRRGYVEIKRENNESFFHLTPKGRLAVLKHLHLEKLLTRKWDGNWRVAIFDIPEELKAWREYLRPKLKDMGFFPLQESVYITPYPVTEDLNQLLDKHGLRDHFRYLTVTEIDGESELKKQFKLK